MGDERQFTHLMSGEIHVRGYGTDDEALARLASRQGGIVGRAQLLDLGVNPRRIARRLAAGRLRHLHAGVYAVGHEALTHGARALAAVMAVAPRAGASYLSATALWALADPPAGCVHVTATASRRPRDGIVVHRALLPPEDLTIVEGVPVTTVARTLLDLSGVVDPRTLRRLAKQAEFDGLASHAELAAILDRYPRRRGRRDLRRIVERGLVGAGRTQSELEDRFLAFCQKRGIPLPEMNVPLMVGGKRLIVDCVWRRARLVVELDGRQAHATATAFAEDRARDRLLVAAGWSAMRATWADLHHDPDALEAEIRGVLRRHERRFRHLWGA